VLDECGILVCHIGAAETMNDLPISFLNVTNDVYQNHWSTLIKRLQHEIGYKHIIDYVEVQQKFVIAMKCSQCRSNWLWNEAEWQIQILHRIISSKNNEISMLSYFDGASMMQYQFTSRIVEEVWRRNENDDDRNNDDDDDDNNNDVWSGHGYDPEKINVPLSSLEVRMSNVANGGRGVYTTQKILKGSIMFLEDCVEGMFIPSTTFASLRRMYNEMKYKNISDFWEVVFEGYVYGYGWSLHVRVNVTRLCLMINFFYIGLRLTIFIF
jgi:hypothetical protein